jgi:DNA polymerase III delta prime subunit
VCLIGGPGIGKTTLALILANSSKNSDILFVSCASGEGKMDSIQTKIVPFCQSASRGRKFVILDELDSASASQANSFQKALRNVIEAFPDCRFIATANYKENVIGPLCPSRLPPESLSFSVSEMISNLLYILGEENIEIVSEPQKTKQFLGKLIKSYYPDMRSVVGQLQAACVGGKLDVESISTNNKEAIKSSLARFLSIIKGSDTPLNMRKAYNNEVISFGNNGNLAKLCTPYGLAEEIFNHLVENYNIPVEDLMDLVERLYKIEHSIDAETQLFGYLLKIKNINFVPVPDV